MRRLGRKGFTLVEIMIVVAIIILLAAIAIPNLLRARHNANEAAAIGSLRTLSTALESFRAAQTTPGYPTALTVLSGATPPYIDTVLASASATQQGKQGYYYTFSRTNANQYTCSARPVTSAVTGTRSFYLDEDGVIMAGGVPVQ
ncbi:type II secretion system protein [Candidatus Omnitrophota bacterium]